MYLSAKRYVSKVDYKTDEVLEPYKKLAALFPDLNKTPDNIYGFEVSKVVAYWRKANQIHQWFVENVQDGQDDCRSYRVSREQLKTLVNMCDTLLKTKDAVLAEEVLPTQGGFFFGDTGYGDYYWDDLETTSYALSLCLELSDEWEFEYQSSW